MIECEVKCQWVIAMQHTEYRLIIVFSYNGDINSIIFNGVKLIHVIVNLEKSLVFSVVSTHTEYKWGPSSISAVAELVS